MKIICKYNSYYGGTGDVEMDLVSRVQILDKAVCISLCFNAFEKTRNPFETELSSFVGRQTHIEERIFLNSKPSCMRITTPFYKNVLAIEIAAPSLIWCGSRPLLRQGSILLHVSHFRNIL